MSVRKAIAEHRGIYWVDGMAGMEATDKAIGPAIALKVNGGDKVQMETWARYEEKISYEGLDVAALASMLGVWGSPPGWFFSGTYFLDSSLRDWFPSYRNFRN